ncbi:hypothetical protein MW887_007812 [Aspergillus wentii]|nr:hypothetical protein MW887_007812 [Aspergillus wentii]
MFPQVGLEALSGICGSISIACWVVVFSPQIIENFRRGSAEGLSLVFLVIWLAGDIFNILGSVLQGVLPTMTILAVYYTLADIVLLGQCFYYRGFTLRDEVSVPATPTHQDVEDNAAKSTERTSLLSPKQDGHSHQSYAQDQSWNGQPTSTSSSHPPGHRRHSGASIRDILHSSVDGTHLSPATPFVDTTTKETRPTARISTVQAVIFNTSAIVLVCIAGFLGWYVSQSKGRHQPDNSDDTGVEFSAPGQIFGYLCAVLYLGSRLPQILLNFRRKSTEGVSLLFFIFACLGNLTYVFSILAYTPACEGDLHKKQAGHCQLGEAAALYGKYILVNLSWLIGSFGTLLLDMVIFVQFFLYKDNGSAIAS